MKQGGQIRDIDHHLAIVMRPFDDVEEMQELWPNIVSGKQQLTLTHDRMR